MVKVGIIGALKEEVDVYLSKLSKLRLNKKSGFDFFSGKMGNVDLVIIKSGVGKVNASMCTQFLIDDFNPDYIIFTGVAGALNPELNIKDIVISKDSIQHDIDASSLGFPRGTILFTELRNFSASDKLANLAYDSAKSLGFNAIKGRMLTGDQFITDSHQNQDLVNEFQGDCVDMESAAVAQVADFNNIPHVIIRTISDKADHSADVNFTEFCKEAAEMSYEVVVGILKKLEYKNIKEKIRTIPNWPKPGIMFRDITTLLNDKEGFKEVVDIFYDRYKDKEIDVVAGIDARGFIFASAVAYKLGVGFVPIRKPGKLPSDVISQEYVLEYGTNTVEIHKDAIKQGDNVLVIDDLVATGGTAQASCNLIEKLGGNIVECGIVIVLPDLNGKKKLSRWPVYSIVEFEGD